MPGAYGIDDATARWEAELGFPWVESDWIGASSFFRVKRDQVPVLLIAGGLDERTRGSQSKQLFTALERMGKDAELVVYPTSGHGLRGKDERDAWKRILAWFERDLLSPGKQLPAPSRPADAGLTR